MKKINKKIIISVALIILTIFSLSNSILATNPDKWEPEDTGDHGEFMERAGIIVGWIQYIGILVSIIALTIIGIKYLFSSVEGKAEYKKTMLPYVLGCFLLAGTSLVVGLIADIASVDSGTGTGSGTSTGSNSGRVEAYSAKTDPTTLKTIIQCEHCGQRAEFSNFSLNTRFNCSGCGATLSTNRFSEVIIYENKPYCGLCLNQAEVAELDHKTCSWCKTFWRKGVEEAYEFLE